MRTGFALLASLFVVSCSVYKQDLQTISCGAFNKGDTFSKSERVQAALSEIAQEGVPGATIAVYSDEGWWTASAGFAKLEDKTPIGPCHLHYLQSVSKTYMAIAILRLYEQGKIDLSAPIISYLPAKYSRYITDAEKITVQMLLSHTSGVPEYNLAPAYVSKLLQQPGHHFEPEDYLKYIDKKPLDFTPGSKYAYRNTNYLLLALMADALTGDHARFISENIFKPLGLASTFYRNEARYLTYPEVVNSYWDRFSDGAIENVSQLQRTNVSDLIGDDGIVATSTDAVKFLKALVEEKLLKGGTFELMKSWSKDSKGNPTYGLGLDHATFRGKTAYGHSGGGIGAGCQLYYFPDKNLYVFIGVNLGTVTESPLHAALEKSLDKIYEALLE